STRDDLAESGDPATSMLQETGRSFDIRTVADRIAGKLAGYHARYLSSKEEVLAEWKRENRLMGTAVTAIDPLGAEIRGVFSDIAPDGSMVIETRDGTRRFSCGDVKLPADGGNR
ncbi:MAG: hypothetical protein MJ025_06860, partial [Victivallaceae bacterium]|nr:hypothetical protein [Victivallaceae bacterium]